MVARNKMRFRWSLRTMLLVMVSGTLIFGLMLRWASERHRFVEMCEDRGWRVCFEFEYHEDGRRNITFDIHDTSPECAIQIGEACPKARG